MLNQARRQSPCGGRQPGAGDQLLEAKRNTFVNLGGNTVSVDGPAENQTSVQVCGTLLSAQSSHIEISKRPASAVAFADGLALRGPVAIRVENVVPGLVALLAGGDGAASQLEQQLLGGGARQRVGQGVGYRRRGLPAQFGH